VAGEPRVLARPGPLPSTLESKFVAYARREGTFRSMTMIGWVEFIPIEQLTASSNCQCCFRATPCTRSSVRRNEQVLLSLVRRWLVSFLVFCCPCQALLSL
jgi:hypothetical protein